jgi:hypothetical protein
MAVQNARSLLVSLLLCLSLGAQALVALPPNACNDVSLVVDALRIEKAADAFCSSILHIPTVTVSVTATTPTVSASTTISIETEISGVSVFSAALSTVVSASVS